MSSKDIPNDSVPATPKEKGVGDVAAGESQKITTNHLGFVDGEHIFSDPDRASYWRRVYDKANYEGRRRFDPELTWSASAERLLIRKVFWKSHLF